jgi:hypothetical protein
MAAPQRRPTDRYRTYVKKSDKLTPRVSIRRFHDIFSAPGFTWIHLDSLGFTWSFSELPLNWKVGDGSPSRPRSPRRGDPTRIFNPELSEIIMEINNL